MNLFGFNWIRTFFPFGIVPKMYVIGSIGGAVGGLFGGLFGKGKKRRAEEARQKALAEIAGVRLPTVAEQELSLEAADFLGGITPEMEEALALDPSRLEDIEIDPRLAAAQMSQLEMLQKLGSDSFTPEEQAQLNALRRSVGSQEQARQNAILQEMAQRGVLGSGMELAARLSSSQGAAQRQAEEADRLAAMAHARALEGMTGAGNLATSLRQQQFGEEARVADAADAISKFNLANKQNIGQRNIDRANQEALRQSQEQQRLHEADIYNRNRQQEYNKRLLQQQYQNERSRAADMANIYTNKAARYDRDAANIGQAGASIGSALGQGIEALSKPSSSDDESKKDNE